MNKQVLRILEKRKGTTVKDKGFYKLMLKNNLKSKNCPFIILSECSASIRPTSPFKG